MPTNVVFIMTDNQGAWTLGCHGNPDIRTPQIDRLASQGVRFSNAYCVNSVCSPSRATYLTGLIPSQHGVHCYLGGEKPDAQIGPDAYCTIDEFMSLPRILAVSGYTCGLSGMNRYTPSHGIIPMSSPNTRWTFSNSSMRIRFFCMSLTTDRTASVST